MPTGFTKTKQISLSVVVPAYNAASWLPKSMSNTALSVKAAGIKKAEFIVVDDGSSDDTAKIAAKLDIGYPVRVISQLNQGRFVARQTGTQAASYPYILFIDTRIMIGRQSLAYLLRQMSKDASRKVWTSHVYIQKKGNIYARFWEALVFIAWRKYFSNPRDCSYGIKDFDHFPKGTTCFFVPKDIISDANKWFLKNTKDLKTSNDDTLLIRRIATKYNINLSPEFNCTYHARTNLKQYVRHVYHRGKVFVDGFLRRDGNRFFWLLIAFLLVTAAILPLLVLFPGLIAPTLVTLLAGWFLGLLVALTIRTPVKDAFSLFILTPVFVIFYGFGIWVEFLKIYVLRYVRPRP